MINANNWPSHSTQNLTFYSATGFFPAIQHFSEALNPALWDQHYSPLACVIVDKISHDILLVRDHLGIQPLYYYHDAGQFIFAENLPALLAQLPEKPRFRATEIKASFANSLARQYSDHTLYAGIERVEPGHMLHITPDGTRHKTAFWQLPKTSNYLQYPNDADYVEHFSELLQEAIKQATDGFPADTIGAEFSAGLDSTAVYVAATQQGLNPYLFMHTAFVGSKAAEVYNDKYEQAFLRHYPLAQIDRIGAEDFNAIETLQNTARLLGDIPPHLFYIFAQNIHQAVAKQGCKILLSGFGGDQGVSGHAPLRAILPELLQQRQYRKAWQTIRADSAISFFSSWKTLLKSYHPFLHKIFYHLDYLRNKNQYNAKANIEKPYWRNLAEYEWQFLQGQFNHEVRMRIEYSSLISKAFGFEYRYPLLHPKLLEFYLRIPPEQKRRNGSGRYLIKRYVGQFIPEFAHYKKQEGLFIMSATIDSFTKNWKNGLYEKEFSDLPYQALINNPAEAQTMINTISAYMLKQLRGNP